MEDLLSIKEAARLMGVCENTLRDWDIEKKFTAIRTAGGHRRYSLAAIREYLDKHDAYTTIEKGIQFSGKDIVLKWEATKYLDGITDNLDKYNLAILLDNIEQCRKNDAASDNEILSSSQTFFIVSEAWKLMRFKKMISIQAMHGPCCLAYYTEQKNGIRILSEAVAAKITQYDFNLFTNANFDVVKELYINALAVELDMEIFNVLYKLNPLDIKIFLENTDNDSYIVGHFNFRKELYDYIIGPEGFINTIKDKPFLEGVDFYTINTILDAETYLPMAVAGKYITHVVQKPVFLPYMFLNECTTSSSSIKRVVRRTGWLA